MNIRSVAVGRLRGSLKTFGSMVFFTLIACPAWAQSTLKSSASVKARGEIVSASQTTINGFSAVSGMSVFGGNRIKTGSQGAAVVNLGKLGRIECGAETDITLRLSEAGIGGDLRNNRLVVSAPAGVPVTINTPQGVVTTDGRRPAVLTIYASSERTRVIAHVGAATIVSSGKDGGPKREDRIEGAGEFSHSPGGEAGRRAGFTDLFKAGIDHSIDWKSAGDSKKPVETSITCLCYGSQKTCHKKSEYKPRRRRSW